MNLARIFQPFSIAGLSEEKIQKNVELVRILTALFLIHRHIDVLGFSVIQNPHHHSLNYLYLALCFCILFGFLTPFAIIFYAMKSFIFGGFISYLGPQVGMPLFWGMLLLGTGRSYSIDSLLSKKFPKYRSTVNFLHIFELSDTHQQVRLAKARFFVIFTYWGICFSAMSFHFLDEMWLKGNVLQHAYTMPYFNDHYQMFRDYTPFFPKLYSLFCIFSLYLQGTWELLLFGLMFFHLGRIFSMWQGLGFFMASLLFLNLGYLPLYEMSLWLLLFNYKPLYSFKKHTVDCEMFKALYVKKPLELVDKLTNKGIHPLLFTAALVVVLSFQIVNPGNMLMGNYSEKTGKIFNHQVYKLFLKTFGQGPVNVFNRKDFSMGDLHFVLFEKDTEGKVKRIVPFLDIHGGRLDYMRNDLLYFVYSLRWQRLPISAKFINEDKSNPSLYTKHVIENVATVDYCIRGYKGDKKYYASFISHPLIEGEHYLVWDKTQYTGHTTEISLPATLANEPKCRAAFNLPPGHFNSDSRLKATEKALREFLKEN